MICPKCGTMVPSDRDSCLNCGASMEKKDPFEGMEGYENEYVNRDGVSTRTVQRMGPFSDDLMNRWAILGLGMGGALLGFFGTIALAIFFPYLVYLWSIAILVVVMLPLFGGIFQVMGFNRTGGIMMIIGGIPLVPIGLIPIIGGVKALKAANHADEMREKHPEAKEHGGVKIRTSTAAKITLGVLIAVMLLIPGSIMVVGQSRPLLYFKDVDYPQSFRGDLFSGGNLRLTIQLGNMGWEDAEEGKIAIHVTTDEGTLKHEWTGGDCISGGESTCTLNVNMDGIFSTLESVSVYYNGMITDWNNIGVTYSSF
ncbi:MAG: zinc ribbon domain-containing protein [Thermoplasmatota archaeon]